MENSVQASGGAKAGVVDAAFKGNAKWNSLDEKSSNFKQGMAVATAECFLY